MSDAAASTATARYADAFVRRKTALPGHDSAGPREAMAGA